ncbi:MAG: hypothetical protein OXU37_06610 [Thaumarchaeota archaeon]|nr:hypothetical protein [Nitrososphaerota archaeon]
MHDALNINVSAVDYDATSKAIRRELGMLEESVHAKNEFRITDSEFAFGWHFFVVSVTRNMVERVATQMGGDFESLKGKGTDKKFLRLLEDRIGKSCPRFKLAIKEEMESSKFGIF